MSETLLHEVQTNGPEYQAGFEPNMHGSEGFIDPSSPLMGREDALKQYGLDAAVVADLRLGGNDSHQYLVLDLGQDADSRASITPILSDRRGAGHQEDMISHRRFVIVEGIMGEDGNTHFSFNNLKGMKVGEKVDLGSNHNKDRFSYNENVSENHVAITRETDGLLKIADTSEKGTAIYYNQESNNSPLVQERQRSISSVNEAVIDTESGNQNRLKSTFASSGDEVEPSDVKQVQEFWDEEKADVSEELKDHEIPEDLAEEVGDVAVKDIIEEPTEAAVEDEQDNSVEKAQDSVEAALSGLDDTEQEDVAGDVKTEVSNKSAEAELSLSNKQIEMVSSVAMDVQKMRQSGVPQYEIDNRIGGVVNSIISQTKKMSKEENPEPGLELAALALEFGAHSQSHHAYNEIRNTDGLGKDEQQMFKMFADKLDHMKRDLAENRMDPLEFSSNLQSQIRVELEIIDTAPDGFNKRAMEMIILATAAGASLDIKQQKYILSELHGSFVDKK